MTDTAHYGQYRFFCYGCGNGSGGNGMPGRGINGRGTGNGIIGGGGAQLEKMANITRVAIMSIKIFFMVFSFNTSLPAEQLQFGVNW